VITQKLQNLFQEYPDKRLIITGLLLTLFVVLLFIISLKFDYEIASSQKPIILFVSLLFVAGVIYLYLFKILPDVKSGAVNLRFILFAGLILRILFIYTTPVLEDDFYRYLWDGANLANGMNPYRIPPETVINSIGDDSHIPPKMQELAKESGEIIYRINHPYVRTIYPVITQIFFALSYVINPWSLIAWKFVLLCVDVMFVFILVVILRQLKISPAWVSLYWWNPLILKEIFNSGHMDILIFPFLFLALSLSMRKNFIAASVLLGLAANVKIWPVLLLPLILKPLLNRPKKMIIPVGLFIGFLLLTIIPANPLQNLQTSSFFNYSTRWELNDSLFKLILLLSQAVINFIGFHPGHAQMLARLLVITMVMGTVILVLFRKNNSSGALFENSLIIITVLFLLSPTQFPWYYSWIIPFLCIYPRFSLLLFTPLLSLYYLRYFFESINNVALFDNWLVWVQYIPVWIILVKETLNQRTTKSVTS
jgi:hypothetical protein